MPQAVGSLFTPPISVHRLLPLQQYFSFSFSGLSKILRLEMADGT